MTTTSYPKSAQNFPTAQWRQVFDGQTGVVGSDGSATTSVDLGLSSTDNNASVKAGKVWYRGYILDIDAADPLSTFALAAATGPQLTYSIGVMFDPAAEATGPLSLYHALKTAIVIPTGGSYLPLYEVTRSPSQILSAATKVDLRRFLGPQVTVAGQAGLPATAPVGTRAFDGVDQWVRSRNSSGTGAQWDNLTNPAWTAITPSAVPSAQTTTSVVLGADATQTPRSRMRLGKVELTGAFKFTNGNGFAPGSTLLGTIAVAAHRPLDRTVPLKLSCEQGTGFNTLRADLNTAGQIIAYVPVGASSFPHWISLEDVSFNPKVS